MNLIKEVAALSPLRRNQQIMSFYLLFVNALLEATEGRKVKAQRRAKARKLARLTEIKAPPTSCFKGKYDTVKAQEEGKAASRPRGDQEEPKRELYEARAKGSMCMQRNIISFAAAAAFSTPPWWSQVGG